MIKGKIIGLLLLFILQVKGTFAQWSIVFNDTVGSYGIQGMQFLNSDTGYAVGYNTLMNNSFLLKTFNGGQDWDTLFFPTSNYAVSVNFPNKDTGYIASIINTQVCVLRSIDAGNTWQNIAPNLMNGNPQLIPIWFLNGKQGIISTSWPNGGAWITHDAGVSWNLVFLSNGGVSFASFNHGVWVGGKGESITYSPDSLVTFFTVQVDTNGFYSNGTDYAGDSIFFDYGNGQNGTDLGYTHHNYGIMYRSLNYGNNWQQFHFTDMYRINDIEITPNAIYAMAEPKVINDPTFLKSIDGGNTWYTQAMDTNFIISTSEGRLLSCLNDTICYAAAHGTIFKTTNGGGPLLSQIGFQYTGMENESSFVENEFSIYPNPSDGNFTLSIPKNINSEIKISVHDLRGRLIYTNTSKTSSGQIPVNIEKAEPGMYIVNVETPEQVSTLHIIKHK